MINEKQIVNPFYQYVDQLLVVIVLYRSTLVESNAYQSITKAFAHSYDGGKQVDLMIVNNGPIHIECQTDDAVFRLHYVERLDNPGVSKAYNLAGQLAGRLQKQWLLVLDQDTILPINFWDRYNESIRLHPTIPIHAPKLWSGDVLISPCKYRFYRGTLLPTNIQAGLHSVKGRNVLNSGLLIRVDALHAVGGYNESVRLYFSDFVFFDRIKNQYDEFAVVDVNLIHDLSSTDYSSQKIASERFLLYCQGGHAAAEGSLTRSIIYFVTIGARSLLMGKRFGTLLFVKAFLHTWFR